MVMGAKDGTVMRTEGGLEGLHSVCRNRDIPLFLGLRKPGFQPSLVPHLPVWPWASHFSSLGLSSHICHIWKLVEI